MAEFSWSDIIFLGGTSGVFAGITNQLFGYARDRANLKGASKAREDERLHQQQLRSEQAHDEARSKFLPMASKVHCWIDYHWGQDFGHEVDYHGFNAPVPDLSSPAKVIQYLDQIALEHTTKTVRAAANTLRSSVDGCYNMSEPWKGTEGPEREEYKAWLEATTELIELLHTPNGPNPPTIPPVDL